MHLSYSLAVQQFTKYNRDAKLQQMPYVYISYFYRAKHAWKRTIILYIWYMKLKFFLKYTN